MPFPAPHRRYTIEEYVRLEKFANVKHEFLDGQIYALAGGTPEHAARVLRIGASLLEQLRDRRCTVYSPDARVRVTATGLDTYPDATVVCGEERRDEEDPLALANPIVLVEVLSESTEEYDRGEKLQHYQRIPTLEEVVLVSHREPAVEVWRRGEPEWSSAVFAAGETADLESIDCRLEVDEIFRDPLAD